MNINALAKTLREMSDDERQELANEIEKPQVARWKPEVNDEYVTIDSCGILYHWWWGEVPKTDLHRYARGEVFRTEEECLAHDKRIKAIQTIKDYIADKMIGRKPLDCCHYKQLKYFVYYDHRIKVLGLSFNTSHQGLEPCFYGHKDIMEQAMIDLADEYKLMLGVG